ncbi:hypothetical protein ACJZ2D_016155 [Fusarium nematophilum]
MATVTLDNQLENLVYSVGTVQLRGFLSTQHVANFLNIQYADAPVRFRPAEPLRLYDLPTPYDATQYGPRCPQEDSTFHLTMSHIISTWDRTLACFVWIHGGAFNVGDNTVQFGLHDQRIALQWIQSSIHHFWGDPTKVTLCGESAGAYSVLCHTKGGIPLFQQAMIQSPPFPPLRTPQEAQAAFDKLAILAESSLDASSTDKLQALRSLTTQQLMDLFDGAFCTPIEDPDWFVGYDRDSTDLSTFWADLPSWCLRVIFGNTRDESALMLADVPNLTAGQAVELAQIVTPYASDTAIPMVKSHTKRELIVWSSYQAFVGPLMRLASAAATQSPGTQLYGYRICCPDPFPVPLQSYAWHSYGIPFTFNQPVCRDCPELAAMQDNLTSAFLKFLYGHEPWEAFNNARKVMHWSNSGGEMASGESLPADEKQNSYLEMAWNLIEKHRTLHFN